MVKCHRCDHELDLPKLISRRETCLKCHSDVRCCKMCIHYDPKHYNECRESQAERMVEKDKANFCSYFLIKNQIQDGQTSPTEDALAKARSLFKN